MVCRYAKGRLTDFYVLSEYPSFAGFVINLAVFCIWNLLLGNKILQTSMCDTSFILLSGWGICCNEILLFVFPCRICAMIQYWRIFVMGCGLMWKFLNGACSKTGKMIRRTFSKQCCQISLLSQVTHANIEGTIFLANHMIVTVYTSFWSFSWIAVMLFVSLFNCSSLVQSELEWELCL